MRAAIYARVSTKDKGQPNENQLRELRAFESRLVLITVAVASLRAATLR